MTSLTWKLRIPVIFTLILAFAMIIAPRTTCGQYWRVMLDGAPTLNPGTLEIAPFGAGAYYANKMHSGTTGYLPGIRAGIGIFKNLDVKLSYSRGFYKAYNEASLVDSRINDITLVPKVSLLDGHIAFRVPVSLLWIKKRPNTFGRSTSWYFAPALIGTGWYKQYFEVSLATRFEVMTKDDWTSYYIGGVIGFAFSSNLQRWSLRPEGFISYYLPKKSEVNYKSFYYGWGLAFTYNIDLFKGKK